MPSYQQNITSWILSVLSQVSSIHKNLLISIIYAKLRNISPVWLTQIFKDRLGNMQTCIIKTYGSGKTFDFLPKG